MMEQLQDSALNLLTWVVCIGLVAYILYKIIMIFVDAHKDEPVRYCPRCGGKLVDAHRSDTHDFRCRKCNYHYNQEDFLRS